MDVSSNNIFLISFFVLHIFATSSFPNYDNPVTAESQILRPKGKSCVVRFDSISISNYNYVWHQKYTPPVECINPTKKLAKVILDFNGTVSGVQFDRYGALWFDGIEILRTTTPEPSPAGISWHIEKDLTEYSSIFKKNNATVSLSIPNVINPTYTGILNIVISLTFYMGNDDNLAPQTIPTIIIISDPTNGGSNFPWDNMALKGINNKTFNFTMPTKNNEHIYLDLYASAHGNEEFWNIDAPGGSTYRQFVIYIDGQGAGIAYPFPVIYTGGVCPYLWRPLTGILSFNIPPYRFNLSPFAGILNDGKQHKLSIHVFGDSSGGSWFVDPVLISYPDKEYDALPGILTSHIFKPHPDIRTTQTKHMNYTYGNHALQISGVIYKGNQNHTCTIVNQILSTNTVDDRGLGNGTLQNMFTSTYGQEGEEKQISHTTITYYPYRINSTYDEDKKTFSINATVQIERSGSEKWIYQSLPSVTNTYLVEWSNTIRSDARYNRSKTNHSEYYDSYNKADELFSVYITENGQRPIKACYDQEYHAFEGAIVSRKDGEDRCKFYGQISLCDSQPLCGLESMLHHQTKTIFSQNNDHESKTNNITVAIEHPRKISKAKKRDIIFKNREEKNMDDHVWITMRRPTFGKKIGNITG